MEIQKTSNSQSNQERRMELEESTFSIQITLQSYSHQDTMVLAQKQKNRPMEQDRKPREKLSHIWAPYL